MRELEFLPDDYLRARFDRRLGFIRSWLLLALALAMMLWSLQMGTWVRNARAELVALHLTGSAMDADVAKARLLKAEAREHNRRVAALDRLAPRTSVARVLGGLARALPDGAVLNRADVAWTGDDGGAADVRLAGSAETEAVVGQTVGALESSAMFARAFLVESKAPEAGSGGGRCFVIEVTASEMGEAWGEECGQ